MRLFDCFSIGLLLALSANLVIIFFLAFFNGHECLVTVNDFGEAQAEAVIFPLVIIMGAVTFIRIVKATNKREVK